MPTTLEIEPDSPEWWNRQLTYIMDETYHALKQAVEAPDKESSSSSVPLSWHPSKRDSWIRRAEYLRNKAIECVENAYNSIQLQTEERENNE